ncbi:MAG TPA: hypothetical protein VFO55_06595 [Gemmatimonadaceae bacterium]|nr:hypothetical protein [Gemmatimonadaceae bacterium]
MPLSGARSPSRRAAIAIGVLLFWAVGLGLLARREFFRPRLDLLTEAGLRINQYTSFFALRQNGQLVGYGSSMVDTTTTEITITDFMVRETSIRRPRSSKRAKIRLSRTFRLKEFESAIATPTVNIRTTGKVDGDSLVYTLATNDKAPTTGTIRLDGPVLLPQMVPLAIALMDEPSVGRKYTFPVFDPSTQSIVQVKSEILRDTTFVLSDSAVVDTTTRIWTSIRQVPVKAWLISSSPGGYNGWLDETGHIVRTTELDADVLRSTIEEAFENWMVGVNQRRRAAGAFAAPPDASEQRPRKP